jgi:hypothetical protein
MPNVNSGKELSEKDLFELKNFLYLGDSIETIADFLYRDLAEVQAKVRELREGRSCHHYRRQSAQRESPRNWGTGRTTRRPATAINRSWSGADAVCTENIIRVDRRQNRLA